jgi:putative transposase
MDDSKRLEIATFRYGVIAPVLHDQGKGQMEYFRSMASRRLDVPHVGLRRYAPGTFKSWLQCYRQDGLDGLIPKQRSDAGSQRVITPEMMRAITLIDGVVIKESDVWSETGSV